MVESLWVSTLFQFLSSDPALSMEKGLSNSSVLVFNFQVEYLGYFILDPSICPSCCLLLYWAVLIWSAAGELSVAALAMCLLD